MKFTNGFNCQKEVRSNLCIEMAYSIKKGYYKVSLQPISELKTNSLQQNLLPKHNRQVQGRAISRHSPEIKASVTVHHYNFALEILTRGCEKTPWTSLSRISLAFHRSLRTYILGSTKDNASALTRCSALQRQVIFSPPPPLIHKQSRPLGQEGRAGCVKDRHFKAFNKKHVSTL